MIRGISGTSEFNIPSFIADNFKHDIWLNLILKLYFKILVQTIWGILAQSVARESHNLEVGSSSLPDPTVFFNFN